MYVNLEVSRVCFTAVVTGERDAVTNDYGEWHRKQVQRDKGQEVPGRDKKAWSLPIDLADINQQNKRTVAKLLDKA